MKTAGLWHFEILYGEIIEILHIKDAKILLDVS